MPNYNAVIKSGGGDSWHTPDCSDDENTKSSDGDVDDVTLEGFCRASE